MTMKKNNRVKSASSIETTNTITQETLAATKEMPKAVTQNEMQADHPVKEERREMSEAQILSYRLSQEINTRCHFMARNLMLEKDLLQSKAELYNAQKELATDLIHKLKTEAAKLRQLSGLKDNEELVNNNGSWDIIVKPQAK